MPQIDPDEDLEEILKLLTGMKDGPYIMQISADSLSTRPESANHLNEYSICSACFSVIEQTWDHSEWCELFKDEPLSEWIKKGKKK